MPTEFDLNTFEGWLKYQGFDPATQSAEMLADWKDMFDEVKQRSAATPKVGLMSRSTSRTLRIDNLSAGIGNPALLQGP
jgi:hypothetical protein